MEMINQGEGALNKRQQKVGLLYCKKGQLQIKVLFYLLVHVFVKCVKICSSIFLTNNLVCAWQKVLVC